MTRPSWSPSPRLPAAAIGPGVGGTRVWVAKRPVARATDIATMEVRVRRASDSLSEFKMT